MERFTEKLLNFNNLSLFHVLKGYSHPNEIRRVPQSSQFEMTFYPPIFPEQCQYQAVTVGDSIHARIETIVKQDPSQWWYWEIFETTRHLLRGE